MFSKILIANRGEIAVRIIRACREMGISTVAVYSDPDRDALHVSLADEAYCIGGSEAGESYLNEKQIISAAVISGAKAIHPGYGFLSENAHFARLCGENGIVFIGPDPESMERLSDKALIKGIMKEQGLTVIEGTDSVSDAREAERAAEKIGYPVMIKAVSGGGGRGIRLVKDKSAIRDEFLKASAEASSAFGDGRVYIEKYVFPARHVEMQILADSFGNAVCLGDRDCSVQMRNQKLIEESPSPSVKKGERERVMALAAAAAKNIGYQGAGTMEFLVDKDGNFYFMEMNVRLQVEHTVTEMLTGIDLVKRQIRIAARLPLDFTQEDVSLSGTAMEIRVNAKSCGKVSFLHIPGGPGVRFDTCLISGCEVTPYYDSLLGKMIVYAKTRDEALRKMRSALSELIIEGVDTNITDQLDILSDKSFIDGSYDLTFMSGR